MKFDALVAADRQDLIRLAGLLEAGLLSPPFSALSLCDHIAAAHADAVARCFGELSQRDMPPSHIALLLRAFAAGAQAAGGSSLPVEVVVSGPDAAGGARDTGVVMRQLFGKARERVLAVGFASEFVRNERPGKRLPRVYYDPQSLEPAGRTASSMHAKCVIIDGREALVTSANFTEAAQQRNIELGLLEDSHGIAGRIEKHFISLTQNGFLNRIPLP